MRRLAGFLLMGFVVVVFVISIQGRGENDKTKQAITQEKNKTILQIEEKIDTSYPNEPAQVVEVHSELMKILYGSTKNDNLEDYVRTIRKLYSTSFLGLNTQEQQLEVLQAEVSMTQSSNMKLLSSEMKAVYIIKDGEGQETRAEVNVKHVTNQESIERTYYLIKEAGVWKINTWKDVEAAE